MSSRKSSSFLTWLYRAAVGLVLFTGFSNMPISKRYYIADIPGLGWSGDFLLNVQVHYLLGAVLLALAIYGALGYGLTRNQTGGRLSATGKLRGLLLGLALVSGIAMALKNLPGIDFRHPYLMAANLAHLFSAALFMLISLAALLTRRPWIKRRRGQ